jgi:chromosome segregation ATPase
MLAAAAVAEKKDHIFVVKELVKLADAEQGNLTLKEASEAKRDEWNQKLGKSEMRTAGLERELARLTKEKNRATGQLAVLKQEKPTWEAELTALKF